MVVVGRWAGVWVLMTEQPMHSNKVIVCVYIIVLCMYACRCVLICVYACICMNVCVLVCMYYVYIHASVYICMYVSLCVCICAYMYLYVCVLSMICICMYVHVYITKNMTALSSNCILHVATAWQLVFLKHASLLFGEPILLCPVASNGTQWCWQAWRGDLLTPSLHWMWQV